MSLIKSDEISISSSLNIGEERKRKRKRFERERLNPKGRMRSTIDA